MLFELMLIEVNYSTVDEFEEELNGCVESLKRRKKLVKECFEEDEKRSESKCAFRQFPARFWNSFTRSHGQGRILAYGR